MKLDQIDLHIQLSMIKDAVDFSAHQLLERERSFGFRVLRDHPARMLF